MLKLEVREGARIAFPNPDVQMDRAAVAAINDGLAEMRRWRHYGE